MTELRIRNLHAGTSTAEILTGVDMTIRSGEVHALMGPNGSGKSTLSHVLMGRPGYEVTEGSITLDGEDITGLKTWERAQLGLFLVLQYPVEIEGVTTSSVLAASLLSSNEEPNEVQELSKIEAELLGIPDQHLSRGINLGMSGGEKKRYEILQMSILKPSLAILDETDSGLDVDAFRTVTEGINRIKNDNNSFLIITHYQKLLDHIVPDFVHIMKDGKIIKSGDHSIAKLIEESGYKNF